MLKRWTALGCGLVLLGVIGGGYYFYKNKNLVITAENSEVNTQTREGEPFGADVLLNKAIRLSKKDYQAPENNLPQGLKDLN